VGGLLSTSTIPASLVSPLEGELAGEGGDALLSQAGKAVDVAKRYVSTRALQPKLQGNILSVLHDVAQEYGVALPDTAGLRDVAQAVSDGVHAKAHAIYQQLDSALGGNTVPDVRWCDRQYPTRYSTRWVSTQRRMPHSPNA
jgi:hypothetical protein